MEAGEAPKGVLFRVLVQGGGVGRWVVSVDGMKWRVLGGIGVC